MSRLLIYESWWPGAHALREAALCLIAADSALCDGLSAEAATKHARGIEDALDEPPWADGKHYGDCTNQPTTCMRCTVEDAEKFARTLWEE